jgi:hypothetical protein
MMLKEKKIGEKDPFGFDTGPRRSFSGTSGNFGKKLEILEKLENGLVFLQNFFCNI